MGLELQLRVQSVDLSGHRVEVLNGEEHLVVPVVAAVEGVLNGELLTMEEVEKSLPAWNGVAATLAHPEQYGERISANERFAIENFVIGRFFDPKIDGNKFKGDFWINLSQLSEHEDEEEFLAAVENGTTLEVSTAYYRDLIAKSGIYKGKNYGGVATRIIPNHVAILLHEVGACSVDDGCGVPRTNQGQESEEMGDDQERRESFLQKLRSKMGDVLVDGIKAITGNRISHQQTHKKLREAIAENERSDTWIWVVEVFDDEVVYGRELASGEVGLFSRKYGVGSSPSYEINLEDPQEVEQVVSYVPITTNIEEQEEESDMDREKLIDGLVENEALPFTREQFAAMTDEQLQYLAGNEEEDPTEPTAEGGEGGETTPKGGGEQETEEEEEKEPVAANSGLKPDVQNALNELGADGIRTILDSATELADARKQEHKSLVSKLAANERCHISETALGRMDLEALKGVYRSIVGVNYSGVGGPVANQEESSGPPDAPKVVLAEPESQGD